MKWLGQYIQNFKATFRQDVTLDSTLTFDSVALTGIQTSAESFADDDVSIMTSAAIDDRINTAVTAEDLDVAADSGTAAVDLNSQSLTVTGGTNATTSATGQAVTINVDDAFLINNGSDTTTGTITAGGFTTTGTITMPEYTDDAAIGITKIQDSGTAFADNDTSIMTAAAVDDRILDYGYSTTTGDITGVTAGTNLSGGGATGGVTINLADASTSAKGAASFATADFTVSSGAVSLKQKAVFEFKGYGTSGQDGEGVALYDMQQEMSDNQAPFQHDTSTGADGLTVQATTTIMRSGGKVMPYSGKCKIWRGWVASQGTATIDVGIFKFTPVDNNADNVAPVLIDNTQITAAGNTKMRSFNETAFTATFTAGDILYSAVKGAVNAKLWYLNSTLEVEWD